METGELLYFYYGKSGIVALFFRSQLDVLASYIRWKNDR